MIVKWGLHGLRYIIIVVINIIIFSGGIFILRLFYIKYNNFI